MELSDFGLQATVEPSEAAAYLKNNAMHRKINVKMFRSEGIKAKKVN